MTAYKYAFEKYDAERMARASGRDIAVSTKQAIEICSALRRKNLQDAKAMLESVIAMEAPIRFTRFTNGIGHKKGKLGAGAYPQKAAKSFLELLSSVEVNAQNKGLNTGQLALIHICAHKASRPMHHGRKRRSEFKRSHVEIVVAEQKEKKDSKDSSPKKAGAKEEARKAEVKKEEPKTEAKQEMKTATPESKTDAPMKESPETKEAPKKAPEEVPEEEKKEAAPKEDKPSAEKKETPEKKEDKAADTPDQDKKEESKEETK